MIRRPMGPDHPRAIFEGAAEREMQQIRDAQRGAKSPARRPTVPELRTRIQAIEATTKRVPRPTPPDPGEVLVDLPRGDGTVLRVGIQRWCDPTDTSAPPRLYVAVRLWSGGWPVKGKGVSVRAGELVDLATALLDAAEKLSSAREGDR